MDYSRTIILLSLLKRQTKENHAQFFELFKEAISKNKNYQTLMKYLQTSNFIGLDGTKLHEQCNLILNKSLTQIDSAQSNITEIRNLIDKVKYELSHTKELMESPSFFERDFNLVDKEDAVTYFEYYKQLAKSIIYNQLINQGVSGIVGLNYSNKMELKELVRNVNQRYAEILLDQENDIYPGSWEIKKVHLTGDNLIVYEGFVLEHKSGNFISLKSSVDLEKYRRISPNFYVARNIDQNPLYFGYGNIIGIEFSDIFSILDSDIMTKIVCNNLYRDLMYLEPIKSILKALGTGNFCISVGNFTEVMNHASLQLSVKERTKQKLCYICGTPLNQIGHCEIDHLSVWKE